MNNRAEEKLNFDIAKWILASLILGMGIYGNVYYSAVEPLYRMLVGIAICDYSSDCPHDKERLACMDLGKRSQIRDSKGCLAHVAGNGTDNVNGSRNCPPSGTHPLDSRRTFKLGSLRDHRLGENFVKTLVCCTRLLWVRKTSHEGFARTHLSLA